MNVGLDIKEEKTQDIQQKRKMQEQVYEALERDKRRLNLVLIGINPQTYSWGYF